MHEKKTNALTGQTGIAFEGRLAPTSVATATRVGAPTHRFSPWPQIVFGSLTKLWVLLKRQPFPESVQTLATTAEWPVLHDVVTLANSFLTNASFSMFLLRTCRDTAHNPPLAEPVNHHTGQSRAATRILPFEGNSF